MSVIGGWLLAPLVLLLLCTGMGLLAERAARVRLPGPAVPGVGLAALIVVAGLLTLVDPTAELAAPVCAALAVAGWVVGRRRVSAWPVVVVVATFALLAWPSLLSGQASVAGYIKLDDSAIWLGLIAHVMEHGRDISMVPPSTFQLDLLNWLDQGYPIGAFTPVGVTARLTGQDYANVYQPVICLYGALFALGAYGLVRGLVRSRPLAAAAAFAGAQASLFVGYAWWGSIKEICLAALLPLFVLAAEAQSVRVLLLIGLVAAAFMDVFGAGGVVWAGPGCLAAAAIVFRRAAVRSWLAYGAAGAVVLVAGSIPAIAVLGRNASQTTKGAPTAQEDIGKLIEPLDVLQGAGLWPAGDFRIPPDPKWIAIALAVLGLVAAAGAVAVGARRRAWGLPALLAVTVIAAIPALALGAPWIDAKVLAVTSAVLLTGAAALVAIGVERFRLLAAPAVVVLVAGCAASTWLAVRDVYIAPRDTLTELRSLGRQVAGKGPVLSLVYEGYATRYALYRGAVEGASDLRVNLVPSRAGQAFPDFSTVEVDDVDTRTLFEYPLITRRQTPVGSRPPGAYERFATGEFFETWQRRGERPVEHLSLGGGLAPAAPVDCPRLRELARKGSTLAAAPLANPVVADLTTAQLPEGWLADGYVRPVSDDTARVTVPVPEAGEWRVWVGGGALGELDVAVDGRDVGSVRHRLDASIGWMRFGTLELEPGDHTLTISASRSWWQAGRGGDGQQLPLGPIALTRVAEPVVERVPASDVGQLCDGRTYDWVEVSG